MHMPHTGHGPRLVACLASVALASALLAGCGGGGGGGAGASPPPPLPVVDVAVRGIGQNGAWVHLYRDVLHRPTTGTPPDVRVAVSPDAAGIAFTGTELVVADDIGTAGQQKLRVYRAADLSTPSPTPTAILTVPAPAGAVNARFRDLVVQGGDAYLYTSYDDNAFPRTYWDEIQVYRGIDASTNASSPDATLTLAQYTSGGIFQGSYGLAVDDDSLVALNHDSLFVALDPPGLTGAQAPDRTLTQAGDLGFTGSGLEVHLGAGELHVGFIGSVWVYADPAALTAASVPRVELGGPSDVFPAPNAMVRLGDRFFTGGVYLVSPIAVVGFDLDGTVPLFALPDVVLGPPTVGEQRIDGAADTLCVAGRDTAVVGCYGRASTLRDDDVPDVYFFDRDVLQIAEIRAAAR